MSDPTITVGQNCYVSLEDANAIAAERLFAGSWDAADDLTRTKALITAAALLDRLGWEGQALVATQPLAWPRIPDQSTPGYPLDVDTPAEIGIATVEWAIHLLSTGALPGAPIRLHMLGDAMVSYFPTVSDEVPKHVRRLIEHLLKARSPNTAEVRF